MTSSPLSFITIASASNPKIRAELSPERGGMVTMLEVGEPVLYLDRATLETPGQRVRGGIPVLFPAAGRLANDHYGARPMGQHGFARDHAWTVENRQDSEVTLCLDSTPETLSVFPYSFRVAIRYWVNDRGLQMQQSYTNLSPEIMPLHVGFHPYFAVADADKSRTTIATSATRAFNNVTKQFEPFGGFDLTLREVDLHLVDHGASSAVMTRADGTRITVSGSPEFSHWVVWTLAGKDFVCLEPWTAPGNALNTGERLLHIAPGETRRLEIEISAD